MLHAGSPMSPTAVTPLAKATPCARITACRRASAPGAGTAAVTRAIAPSRSNPVAVPSAPHSTSPCASPHPSSATPPAARAAVLATPAWAHTRRSHTGRPLAAESRSCEGQGHASASGGVAIGCSQGQQPPTQPRLTRGKPSSHAALVPAITEHPVSRVAQPLRRGPDCAEEGLRRGHGAEVEGREHPRGNEVDMGVDQARGHERVPEIQDGSVTRVPATRGRQARSECASMSHWL